MFSCTVSAALTRAKLKRRPLAKPVRGDAVTTSLSFAPVIVTAVLAFDPAAIAAGVTVGAENNCMTGVSLIALGFALWKFPLAFTLAVVWVKPTNGLEMLKVFPTMLKPSVGMPLVQLTPFVASAVVLPMMLARL